MNATTALTDLNLLPLGPRRDTGNGTNTASATLQFKYVFHGLCCVYAADYDVPQRYCPGTCSQPCSSCLLGQLQAGPYLHQTSKLAAKSESDTATTAIPAVSHTPEYAKEAGVFYDLTQNIEQGSITLPPAAKDEIHK